MCEKPETKLTIFIMALTALTIINSFPYVKYFVIFEYYRKHFAQPTHTAIRKCVWNIQFSWITFGCNMVFVSMPWERWELVCHSNWVYQQQKRKAQKPMSKAILGCCFLQLNLSPPLCLCAMSHTLLPMCVPFTLSFIGIIVCIFGIHSFVHFLSLTLWWRHAQTHAHPKRQKTNDFDRR